MEWNRVFSNSTEACCRGRSQSLEQRCCFYFIIRMVTKVCHDWQMRRWTGSHSSSLPSMSNVLLSVPYCSTRTDVEKRGISTHKWVRKFSLWNTKLYHNPNRIWRVTILIEFGVPRRNCDIWFLSLHRKSWRTFSQLEIRPAQSPESTPRLGREEPWW